jgi:hypothetical protein
MNKNVIQMSSSLMEKLFFEVIQMYIFRKYIYFTHVTKNNHCIVSLTLFSQNFM